MVDVVIKKMINYFRGDIKRINHALKVYGFAGCIAGGENLSDKEIKVINLAAVLHDIGIVNAQTKHNSTSGHYQEMEGPDVARQLLSDISIDVDILERVCFIIGHHHSYNKIDGNDFQIIVESDFLVNIDEENMSLESIRAVSDKYFKTATGTELIKNIYF